MNENLDKLRDPKFYLENFCKIKTKKGGLHPFILNEAQKDLFNTLRDNTRVMILKCRQLGFSTAVAGYFYVNTIMNVGITSALIGYNSDLVSELLDKIKTFIRTTPAALRPTIQYNSKYEISFPKMDSKILILPSSENVGSGYTIHNCLSGNTNIFIKNGFTKKIKDVEEGDKIINGIGGPSKVKKIIKNKNEKKMLRISIYGTEDLVLTEDHKVLVRGTLEDNSKGVWKEAKDITKKDYVAYPYYQCRSRCNKIKFENKKIQGDLVEDNEIDINFDFGEFIGWYLSEGTSSYGKITISIHRDEVPYVMEVINKSIIKNVRSVNVQYSKVSKSATIVLYGVNFSRFIGEKFGKKCDDKFINDSVWEWGWQFSYGMLKGLFLGDGCLTKTDIAVFTSVNGQLIYQLKKLLISLRIGLANIYYKEDVYRYGVKSRPRYDLMLGGKGNYKLRRKLGFELPVYNNGRARYRLKHQPTANQGHGYWRRGRFHYWARIKRIGSSQHEEFVYDIALEKEPHSFLTTSGVVHNCLLTELSKLDKAEEKMASLMPAIPLGGTFVIESSPKGVGGLYHRMWTEENDWVKKRYDYWWGYSEKQIKQIEREVNDPQIFAQEYKCSFLQSGRSVFEQKIIDSQRKNLLDIGDMNDEHKVYEEEGWVIYKEPEEEGIYVTGADVSDGVSGGDYSVAIIWDRKTGEEVAMYRGYIAPDRFGDLLDKWGRRYNNSYMVPEINNQGLTTLTILKQKAYPNLYFRPNKFESLGSSMTDKLGWRTTRITRPLMISEYAKALRDGVLTIHSKILIDEMSVFIYDDNDNMRPESKTFHDDSIFSAAIGFQGFKTLYSGKLEQIDNSLYLPKSFSY